MTDFTPTFDPNAFRRSDGSGDAGCVEVAITPGAIGVRDSKHQSGPVLAFTEHEWQVFVAGVKRGEFDLRG